MNRKVLRPLNAAARSLLPDTMKECERQEPSRLKSDTDRVAECQLSRKAGFEYIALLSTA